MVGVVSWLVMSLAVVGAETAADFESQVAPLLIKRCVECHRGSNPSGGLLLTTREGLLSGGDSGSVIDLRIAEESPLLQRVVSGEMPPEVAPRGDPTDPQLA